MTPATPPVAPAETVNWLALPSHWPAQSDLLDICRQMGPGSSALMIAAGIVFLLYGYSLYKVLVTLNAAAFGAIIGAMIGREIDHMLAGAFLGAFCAAAITLPTMKYAVAVMGALLGAVLGAGTWQSVQLPPSIVWAGALIGLVFFGMLSFILFRGSIIMYTSFQGSIMLVFGLFGFVLKYQQAANELMSRLDPQPLALPICILIPTILGLLYQQNVHKNAAAA